ncbi:MAG: ABC transporter ATP-binding protein, partial [Spirochaetales bacterium]|nr:ABC transporter ATP-binding protein [Spirochaetales bacterium]
LKINPYEGVIKVFGKDLKKIKKKELYRTMGIVFQNPANQFITQNVLDEVKQSIRLWNNKLSDEEVNNEALKRLDEYGLLRYKRYSPYMLSQGQQRRLAVLSVLAGEQKILLLDEPTYGQDYRSTCAIMSLLEDKIKTKGLSVILITHDEELAKSYADKRYVVRGNGVYEA